VFPSPWVGRAQAGPPAEFKGSSRGSSGPPGRAPTWSCLDRHVGIDERAQQAAVGQAVARHAARRSSTRDTVSIVTYAGSAGTALEPTPASQKDRIRAVIDSSARRQHRRRRGHPPGLCLAEANLDRKGVNRVILATDGDFNVGITDQDELKGYIERERGKGVFLSVLGFGMGNYNDALMQTLAQNGNGTAAYIDTVAEARKTLVEEATSTLFPIAKDVKIQVEFNPRRSPNTG
jgi:Ca-activated chloride channel family protein